MVLSCLWSPAAAAAAASACVQLLHVLHHPLPRCVELKVRCPLALPPGLPGSDQVTQLAAELQPVQLCNQLRGEVRGGDIKGVWALSLGLLVCCVGGGEGGRVYVVV